MRVPRGVELLGYRQSCVAVRVQVYLVQQRMREEGVALMLDVHGDEELPYNFISGNEGIPSWTQRLASLQVSTTPKNGRRAGSKKGFPHPLQLA